jgi:beta-lactamase regulating signal transducer with metallopeptidase domain/tetratricopeptide (TPR) repeat protein
MIQHLIWSTATAAVALAAVFLLRKRSAALRFNILLVAMLRFALPTPWLNDAGASLASRIPAPVMADMSAFLPGPSEVAQAVVISTKAVEPVQRISPVAFGIAIWGIGTALAMVIFLRRLRTPVYAVREANPTEREALWQASDRLRLRQRADLRIVAADHSPGALGFWQPVVLLPDGLSDHLTSAELQAVFAHELAHIQRRDNLTAAISKGIVALFWFHPVVEWLSRKMLIERETACDELVLSQVSEREHYLTGIAKVCQRAIEQSHSYAGITGANLKQRLEHIMSAKIPETSHIPSRAIPAGLAVVAILIPAAAGFLRAQDPSPAVAQTVAQTPVPSVAETPAFSPATQPTVPVEAPKATQNELGPLVEHVEALMSQKLYDAAIRALQAAADKEPQRRDLAVALANVEVRSERYEDAIAIYEKLLRAEPNAADILFRLAETYRRKGDLQKAIDLFQRAGDANQKDVNALLQKSLLLDGTGRKAEAMEVYKRILEIQPDHAVALNNLSYLKASKGEETVQAVEMAQRARKAMPDSIDVADTLGWAYYKNNQPELAVLSFRDAMDKGFDRASIQGHLAMALEKVQNPTPEMKELSILFRDYPSEERDGRIQELLPKLK